MSLLLESPVKLRVGDHSRQELARLLTYRDKTVDFELRRLKNSYYLKQQLGPEAYKTRIDELKDQREKTLVFEDEKGLWTYSGFARKLSQYFGEEVERGFELPGLQPLGATVVSNRTPRPYQLEGVEKLIHGVHAAVEVGTGLGKSFMALMLAQKHGQMLIQAPSLNIAEQLYDDFVKAFGRSRVGFFGDGKKEYQKPFTVAIAASLTKLEPGMPAYEAFRKVKVFVADESHLCPAKTLAKVCFGLMAMAPYRYFFSGTQMRGDGADLLLEGITGPVVFNMTVQEGVDQGWLARPFFKMVRIHSDKRYHSSDANKMTRAHLFYNDDVVRAVADIANKSYQYLGQQVLILVEEVEQFSKLLPYLKHPSGFAHGPLTKANSGSIPLEYQKSDVKQLVQDFNAKKFPILVGTSCISTGTDIQTVEHVIYWQGGKSEVQVRQAVGRGTRKIDGTGKKFFNFTDFIVECDAFQSATCVEKHARERAAIYESIYPNSVQEFNHVQ